MLTQNSIERIRLQLTNVLVGTVAAKIAPSSSKGTLALWTTFYFYFLGSSRSLIHYNHLWSRISYEEYWLDIILIVGQMESYDVF